jgi:hypothetical protein
LARFEEEQELEMETEDNILLFGKSRVKKACNTTLDNNDDDEFNGYQCKKMNGVKV